MTTTFEPGQWVATLQPFPIEMVARVWSRTTGKHSLPAGAIGFINELSSGATAGRYRVTFPGIPPVTLRLRPIDLTVVQVLELHVSNELIDGGQGKVRWSPSRLPLLPVRIRKRASVIGDERYRTTTDESIDAEAALSALRSRVISSDARRQPRAGRAYGG